MLENVLRFIAGKIRCCYRLRRWAIVARVSEGIAGSCSPAYVTLIAMFVLLRNRARAGVIGTCTDDREPRYSRRIWLDRIIDAREPR